MRWALTRIINGFAPEIERLPFVQEAFIKQKDAVLTQAQQVGYLINWSTMTIQDAIDFSVLATRITENIQRFSDGTILAPGGITGVGGDIDIAIITPEKGFYWLKKKRLQAEGVELPMDQE